MKWHEADALNDIAKAEYSLDGSEWKVAAPVTRLSDAKELDYELESSTRTRRTHWIAVRMEDEYGKEPRRMDGKIGDYPFCRTSVGATNPGPPPAYGPALTDLSALWPSRSRPRRRLQAGLPAPLRNGSRPRVRRGETSSPCRGRTRSNLYPGWAASSAGHE